MSALAHGTLLVREGKTLQRLGHETADGLAADLEVRDASAWTRILLGGSLGAAAAYLDGAWESRDLVALVRLFARNRAALEGLEGGFAHLGLAAARALHRLRDNTRRGSRRNIAAHYDLGNDFFRLFLDETLTYSSAFFARPSMTLEEAQIAKIDRLCRKLRLAPGDHLLEIGTGWGSFAIHAARRYGCRVTTTTISAEQRREARARVAAAGLAGRIEVLDRDYRDLAGSYDKIVSVEMIEAVGHRHLPAFFAALDRLLVPGGLAAIQSITLAERHHAAALAGVDFIQRYVFPGSSIPSLTSLFSAIAAASRLTPLGVEDLGLHYARTLAMWSARFESRLEAVRALGYDDSFVRLWRFYLAYCEGGFRERVIGDAQILLAGPRFRGETLAGSLG
ncbi:MAG: cyclopropane-fatty-acyl-phospholipid synthase family protein [Thermoanaerobaculia bacterium]